MQHENEANLIFYTWQEYTHVYLINSLTNYIIWLKCRDWLMFIHRFIPGICCSAHKVVPYIIFNFAYVSARVLFLYCSIMRFFLLNTFASWLVNRKYKQCTRLYTEKDPSQKKNWVFFVVFCIFIRLITWYKQRHWWK